MKYEIDNSFSIFQNQVLLVDYAPVPRIKTKKKRAKDQYYVFDKHIKKPAYV